MPSCALSPRQDSRYSPLLSRLLLRLGAGFSHWLVSGKIRQDVFRIFEEMEWIRYLIRKKLRDGRLPSGRAVRFWPLRVLGSRATPVGPPITKNQMAVEDFSSTGIGKPIHASCFQIWDVERLLLLPPETD